MTCNTSSIPAVAPAAPSKRRNGGESMDEREALNYAARLLEAYQGTAYHPDVEYTPAIGMLRRFADDANLRSDFEDFSDFGKEPG